MSATIHRRARAARERRGSRPRRPSALVAATLAASALLSGGAAAQDPVVEPPSCTLELAPGETASFQVKVKLPGTPVAPRADIYVLADTTGSMGPVLAALKSDVGSLVSSLFSIPGADLRIGIGAYRDFPLQPQNVYAFDHRQSMTDDPVLIQAAVDTWVAMFGGDQAEAGFYALERLATDPPATYGWRPDAKRIIVWFGDAPSHDPVCTQLTGLANDVTESSVITALQSAGPGGTTVISISTPTNLPMGLNDVPTGVNATGYATLCPIVRGSIGQAQRIAAATGGIDTMIANSGDIKQAIQDSLDQVLKKVVVSLVPEGGIVPLVTGISPGPTEVVLPSSPNEFAEVVFTVDVQAGPCVENTLNYTGALRVVLDGNPTNTAKQVEIRQTACFAVCLWGIGLEQTNELIGVGLPGSPDRAYVQPLLVYPVLMNMIPDVYVPDDPALVGQSVYSQILMYNPTDFPNDPLQTSNAIRYVIGQGTQKFGTGSGIYHYPTQNPQPGGCIGMGFFFE